MHCTCLSAGLEVQAERLLLDRLEGDLHGSNEVQGLPPNAACCKKTQSLDTEPCPALLCAARLQELIASDHRGGQRDQARPIFAIAVGCAEAPETHRLLACMAASTDAQSRPVRAARSSQGLGPVLALTPVSRSAGTPALRSGCGGPKHSLRHVGALIRPLITIRCLCALSYVRCRLAMSGSLSNN